MASESPYTQFWDWCFDKNPISPIPNPVVLLKYNSPITETFLLKSMIRIGRLNHYLNQTMNNIGIRYIEKDELFNFIKKCIIDFKVQRKEIHYSPWKSKDELFEKLKSKCKILKPYDVDLLVEIIHMKPTEERDAIYSALGIEKPKKETLKSKQKSNNSEKISAKNFIAKNFGVIKLSSSSLK